MSDFAIVALHLLKNSKVQHHKVLERGRYYFFNNWYKLNNNHFVRNKDKDFERNFFGHNISIQAIVGKNGSGKSSILDMIFRIINNFSYVAVENKYRANAKRLYYIQDIHAELIYELNGKLGRVKCDGNEITFNFDDDIIQYHFASDPESDLDAVNHVDNTNSYTSAKNVDSRAYELLNYFFYSLALNYSIQGLIPQDYSNEIAYGTNQFDIPDISWIDSIYDKNDGYLVPLGIEPYKGHNTIDLSIQKDLANSRVSVLLIDAFFRNKNSKEYIEFIPGYELYDIKFELKPTSVDKTNRQEVEENKYLNEIVANPLCEKCQVFLHCYNIPIPPEENNITDLFRELLKYIIEKTFNITENYSEYKAFINLREHFYEDMDPDQIYESGTIDLAKFADVIDMIMNDHSHISTKIRQAVNLARNLWKDNKTIYKYLHKKFSYFEYIQFFYNIGDKGFNSPKEILEHFPPSIFKYEVFLKKHKEEDWFRFSSLSSGERQYAITTASYLYHIRNILSVEPQDTSRISYRNITLFLDEIELCYHPEYQRSYIHNLINSLELYGITKECDINILLTTHSPFILSDIPKSNILFLDNGKVVNDNISYDTFGANINDLLHKSFFLKDGFSGKNAQKKINDIARQISIKSNISANQINEILNTIEIIGDPLLKHQLNLLYDEYLRKSDKQLRERRIAEIKAELKILEEK